MEIFNDELIQNMIKSFEIKYNNKPQFIGRAPGRVNLIGEHIDYSGFSVFPMALEGKNTFCLISTSNSNKIKCCQFSSTEFGECDLNPLNILTQNGWFKYIESSIKTFLNEFNLNLNGIDIMIHGNVPLASGLSSSASLICSIMITLNNLFNNIISKEDLVNVSIKTEHLVGVKCGGMDQAVSIFAKHGFACLISFLPKLSIKHIKLPLAHFIIAHSAQNSAKVETAEHCYNRRVEEVKKCSEILCKDCNTIGEVVNKFGFNETFNLIENLPEKIDNLFIKSRALHVLTESQRVLNIQNANFEQWGELMDQSHESCKNLYQCSCDALDNLVLIGKELGANGARLTGAGWGGCVVFMLNYNLNPNDFINSIIEKFYKPRNVQNPIIFATFPGEGAESFKLFN